MRRSEGWLVLGLGLVLFLPALSYSQPLPYYPQDPLAGSVVFGSKGCVKCHSINGIGGKIGPDLARIPAARSFDDLAAAMWNHLPQMAAEMGKLKIPVPHLSAYEAANLIAFLYTVHYFEPPGNAAVGRQLFNTKQCIVCHQIRGVGGVVGPSLDALAQSGSPISVAAAMWDHGPGMVEAMRRKGVRRPTFTAAELRDLIAYVQSTASGPGQGPLYLLPGRADDGRRIFETKRCVLCHRAGGKGADVGPDLAKREVHQSLLQFAVDMWNKAPGMMEEMRRRKIPVPSLTPEEMANIVAYLYQVRYFAETGDANRGQQFLTAKGCLACHSLRGAGGKTAPDFARMTRLNSPPAIIAALWNHLPLVEQAGQRLKGAPFKDEEMGDLVAFLQTLGTGKR
jgi:mono/diheme cytochrome c family protein